MLKARLYIVEDRKDEPSAKITIRRVRTDLSEQAIEAMAQQLANIMGENIRVNISGDYLPKIVSPSK